MKHPAKKEKLRKPRTIKMPSRDYQPKKAEKEVEFDMPGADVETVRSAFFRPIKDEQQ